jgi:molecular chaperone GrpE (heat shock protein)
MNNHNSRFRIPVTVNGEEAIPEQSEAQDELNKTQETGCIELEEELEAAQQEADDYKDKYLRAQAEMANFKKRLERRYEEAPSLEIPVGGRQPGAGSEPCRPQ